MLTLPISGYIIIIIILSEIAVIPLIWVFGIPMAEIKNYKDIYRNHRAAPNYFLHPNKY